MSDPFASLIPEARAYLAELAANNSRDWFNDHKARYEAELKGPATLLLEQFAAQIGGAGTKLFRPHRDVRFSKDKTPYNTHLHMLWTLPGGGRQAPGFFFGVAPDYVSIGGGVMGFDKAVVTDWRNAMDGPLGAELEQVLDGLRADGMRIGEPDLKRVPAPFDKDHPRGELLRRKALTVWRDLPEGDFSSPLAALSGTYQKLLPLYDKLREFL
ncbi:MAG: TIGR02453 family protein [Ruegeria sp.]|uniref:TIGR02453 family protein n=1 Tax=Ruegeria sp. TaxID=1879320 RepID=UPI00349EA24A